jgi:hypothetical protein
MHCALASGRGGRSAPGRSTAIWRRCSATATPTSQSPITPSGSTSLQPDRPLCHALATKASRSVHCLGGRSPRPEERQLATAEPPEGRKRREGCCHRAAGRRNRVTVSVVLEKEVAWRRNASQPPLESQLPTRESPRQAGRPGRSSPRALHLVVERSGHGTSLYRGWLCLVRPEQIRCGSHPDAVGQEDKRMRIDAVIFADGT